MGNQTLEEAIQDYKDFNMDFVNIQDAVLPEQLQSISDYFNASGIEKFTFSADQTGMASIFATLKNLGWEYVDVVDVKNISLLKVAKMESYRKAFLFKKIGG